MLCLSPLPGLEAPTLVTCVTAPMGVQKHVEDLGGCSFQKCPPLAWWIGGYGYINNKNVGFFLRHGYGYINNMDVGVFLVRIWVHR